MRKIQAFARLLVKIWVSQVFLDPIQNRISARSPTGRVSQGLAVISIPLPSKFFLISPMLKAPCLGCLSLHINLRDLLRQNHGSLISFAAFEKVIVVTTAVRYFF